MLSFASLFVTRDGLGVLGVAGGGEVGLCVAGVVVAVGTSGDCACGSGGNILSEGNDGDCREAVRCNEGARGD